MQIRSWQATNKNEERFKLLLSTLAMDDYTKEYWYPVVSCWLRSSQTLDTIFARLVWILNWTELQHLFNLR